MKDLFLQIIYRVLRSYATRVIDRHRPFVVAITGSVGKTSTKEAIYQVLSDRFGDLVRRNHGNMNSEIGVPLTILGYERLPSKFAWPFFLAGAYFRTRVRQYPKYLVLEMGVDKPGDIAYLTSIVQPDCAVITSLGLAHLANFKDEEEYKSEKLSILKSLKKEGKAFFNADDHNLTKINDNRLRFVGINNHAADYCADDIELSLSGMNYRIAKTGRKISIKSKQIGAQLIYAQLFAFALGDSLEIPSIAIAASLEKLKSTPGRMNVIEGEGGLTIIDDTYNAASPASVKAALDFLATIKQGRRVFVLGNMNELGKFGGKIHQEVAAYAREKCDLALFAGPEAENMRKEFGGEKSFAFKNRVELDQKIKSLVQKNDIILIKASQNNNYFEETVKLLMKEPERAGEALVRQSQEWMKKKSKIRSFCILI